MGKINSTLVILVFFLISGLSANGQTEIVINEIREYMSQGEQTGFQAAIVNVDPSDVESGWKKFMKKHKAKVKSSRKSVEIFADNAVMKEVSDNTVDVYSIVRPASYGTELLVFVDLYL